MNVETLPIGSLLPASYNPRRMSKHDAASLKRSLEEYGAVEPAVVNADNTIIGGHMRVQAAQQLGWTEFPVVRVDLPDDKAKLLNLALNRISGEWDESLLEEMIYGLHQSESDLALSGFDSKELDTLLAAVGIGGAEEGPIPEPPAEPITRPGDLWLLGPHRVLAGDATRREDVERLMGGARPMLTVTDPPYGVEYEANWRNEAADKGLISHADRRVGAITNDTRDDWREAWELAPGDVFYCWHASWSISKVQDSLQATGFEIRNLLIWAKPTFSISRGHYHWQHEPCWYAVRKGGSAHWIGDRSQTTLWEIPLDPNVDGGLSVQKPVECMARAIRNHEGDVYDPFLGSGTTLIAAHQLGRVCYAMEIEPRYVDVAVTRWQNLTGERATRERAEVAV